MKNYKKVFFTMDIDWAIDPIIDYSLKIFEKNNIKCTIFSTHDSIKLKNLNKDIFEIGIHPNFNPSIISGRGNTAEKIIDDLLNLFPESVGLRSHSMTQSSQLLNLFYKKGIKYDSNQFFPYNWSIKPYKCWTGLTRIPYNWEDDIHFLYKKKFDFEILINQKNFYVFDFHPIHIFLNTENLHRYESTRPIHQDPDELIGARNCGIGIRNAFKELLEAKIL